MLKKSLSVLVLYVLLTLLLTACGQNGQEKTAGSVTVMVYMTGSDLESRSGLGTADLEEMESSGVDPEKVTLLVYTGGSEIWHNGLPAERNTLLRLTADGFVQDADFDLLSMGDPASLSRFLTYAKEQYPAEEYDLILWDHGNGPVMGYGKDKLFENDALTLPELGEALAAGPFGPEERLGVLGFDACLMASVELACVTADYADYLVASEELEPGMGWHYGFLGQAGKVPPRKLARLIVDGYFTAAEEYASDKTYYQADVTMSVTDLSKVVPLRQALETYFAEAADRVSGDYNRLAAARVHAKGMARGGSEIDLIDLGSLVNVQLDAGDNKAKPVLEALKEAVVYNRSNVEGCSGLTLYYPYYNKKNYQKAWRDSYLEANGLESYRTYLKRYEQVWLGSDLQELFQDGLIPQDAGDNRHYTLQLTPEQAEAYAESRYFILRSNGGDLYQLLYMSQNVTEKNGLLTADFDGGAIYVSTAYDVGHIPVLKSTEKTATYETYFTIMHLETADADGMDVRIWLNRDTGTGEVTVTGIYPEQEEETEGKQEPIELTAGGYLRGYDYTYYLKRAEDGRILPFFDWEQYTDQITWFELKTGDGIRFSSAPLYDNGDEYFLMFELTDTQGNRCSSELIPVTLAPAPEEESARERAKESDLPETGEITLPLTEDVTLSLCGFRDRDDGAPVLFGTLANESDAALDLSLSGFRNGQTRDRTDVYDGSCSVAVEPAETKRFRVSVAPQSLLTAGFDAPWALSFSVRLNDTTHIRTLVPGDRYLVRMPSLSGFPERIETFMDAKAERQILTEKDGLTVTLLGAGYWPGRGDAESVRGDFSEKLTLRFLLENSSAAPKDVSVNGIEINGLGFAGISGAGRTVRLDPGIRYPMELSLEQFDVDNMTDDVTCYLPVFFRDADEQQYWELPKRGQIRSISALSVPVVIDGEYRLCPVALSGKGTGETVVPDGEPVFEDDHFTVWSAGSRWLPDEQHARPVDSAPCGFWVRNKTDTDIIAFIGDDASEANHFTVGRHSLTYSLCPGSFFEGKAERRVRIKWKDGNDITSDFQLTDSFLLPDGTEGTAP